jgi:hypothetical protein
MFEFKALTMLGETAKLQERLALYMSDTFRPRLGVADFAGKIPLLEPSFWSHSHVFACVVHSA